MRLVLGAVLMTARMRFPAEDVNERRQAIPEGTVTTFYQLRLAHAVKTDSVLVAGDCAAADTESAPTRSKKVPGVLASSRETGKRAKSRFDIVRVPIHLQNRRAGRRETRGTARTAALGAGSSQQGYATRPNRGLPVPSGGSGTQARIGAAGGSSRAPRNRGCRSR